MDWFKIEASNFLCMRGAKIYVSTHNFKHSSCNECFLVLYGGAMKKTRSGCLFNQFKELLFAKYYSQSCFFHKYFEVSLLLHLKWVKIWWSLFLVLIFLADFVSRRIFLWIRLHVVKSLFSNFVELIDLKSKSSTVWILHF